MHRQQQQINAANAIGMQINEGYVYPQNKHESLFVAGNSAALNARQFIAQSQDAGLAQRNDFFILNMAGDPMLVQKAMDKQNNRLNTGASNGWSRVNPLAYLQLSLRSHLIFLFQQSKCKYL